MASQVDIAQRVVEAILSQKLAPGERLGEQDLANMFGVSRTLVREALMQLQARGFCATTSSTSSGPSTKPMRRQGPSCWPTSTSAWPSVWATSCWPACCAT